MGERSDAQNFYGRLPAREHARVASTSSCLPSQAPLHALPAALRVPQHAGWRGLLTITALFRLAAHLSAQAHELVKTLETRYQMWLQDPVQYLTLAIHDVNSRLLSPGSCAPASPLNSVPQFSLAARTRSYRGAPCLTFKNSESTELNPRVPPLNPVGSTRGLVGPPPVSSPSTTGCCISVRTRTLSSARLRRRSRSRKQVE